MLEEYGLPSDIKVPFVYFGVDNSRAGMFQNKSNILLFGQKFSGGTATPNVAVQVFGNEADLFGYGSMLQRMCTKARRTISAGQVWAVPFDDVGAASQWTVTITAPTTGSPETGAIIIGGEIYRVTALITDSSDSIASKLTDLINDDPDRLVDAVAASNVITLTARHKGETAGKIKVLTEYRRQRLSAGNIGMVVAQTVVGSGVPDISTALAAIGDTEFNWIGQPYVDSATISLMSQDMDDSIGRWSAMSRLNGHVATVHDDTITNRVALTSTLNDQHLSIMGLYGSPTPAYEITAELTGILQRHLSDAPELSRPLQTISLPLTLAPEIEDVDDKESLQTLMSNGAGGFNVLRDGEVTISRVLTTYQSNAHGVPDNSYMDVQTLAQLSYTMEYLRYKLTQTYPRHSLRSDDFTPTPGTYVVTPRIITGALSIWAQQLSNQNVIEDIDGFIERISVQRSDSDPNCLEMVIQPDLVNQFRIAKILVQFYNQYPEAA